MNSVGLLCKKMITTPQNCGGVPQVVTAPDPALQKCPEFQHTLLYDVAYGVQLKALLPFICSYLSVCIHLLKQCKSDFVFHITDNVELFAASNDIEERCFSSEYFQKIPTL